MDPFKILGVDKDASPDEIRRAYRKQASKYHPDSGGDAWIFQQIQDAYDHLTGKTKKKNREQTEKSTSSNTGQPFDSDPFADDPFANDEFEFDIPDPPKRGYSYWQAHAPKTSSTKNRHLEKKLIWLAGITAVIIIIALGGALWSLLGGSGDNSSLADATQFEQQKNEPISQSSADNKQLKSSSIIVSPDPKAGMDARVEKATPPNNSSNETLGIDDGKNNDEPNISLPNSTEQSPLPLHPLLLLTFDEDDESSNKLWDSHAKEFVGANKGATYAQGKVGKALRFSGEGYAEVYALLPEKDAPRTFAAWVKSGPSNDGEYILRYGGGAGAGSMFALLQNWQWRFIDWNGGLDSGTSVDSNWHHHCVTYRDGVINYYLDGVLAASVSRRLATTLGMLFLGTLEPKHERPFDGWIDELVVYDEAISKEQIETLVRYGNESKHLSSGSTIRFSSEQPSILVGHYSEINQIDISPDGKRLVSASADSIRMWNLETGKTIWSSDELAGGAVAAITFDPSGRTVWACGSSRTVHLNAEWGRPINAFDFGATGPAAFTRDCKSVLLQLGGQLRVHDLSSGKMTAMHRFSWTTYLSISSDSKFVLIGGFEDSGTRVFSVEKAEVVKTFPKSKARTMAQFSNDNSLVALWTGPHRSGDNVRHSVKIFESQSGRRINEFRGFGGWQYGVAFSPDNRFLATVGSGTLEDWGARNSGSDRTIRIWDVRSGQTVQTFEGHDGSGNVAIFTPDGGKLITGGVDALIRIWELK